MATGIAIDGGRKPINRLPAGRQLWVLVHRWAGLTLAVFLTIVGLTGSLLPFDEELEFAGRPSLSHIAPPMPGARTLSGLAIAQRVEAKTGARVPYVELEAEPDHPVRMRVTARAGGPKLGYDTVWADPFTGAVLLTYTSGALSEGPQNIMPFLYKVHYALALGAWGTLALGVAALVWTLDCFVGFYLTLPVRRRANAARAAETPAQRTGSFLRRWQPAWLLRARAGGHKLTFDLHRAGGLWLWPLLLVFAWSGVGFNLQQVHQPVMRAMGATVRFAPPALPKRLDTPPLDRTQALARGQALLANEAKTRGFTAIKPHALFYLPASGAYVFYARTSLDAVAKGGRTALIFSAVDGRPMQFLPPTGRSAADGFSVWLNWLHMAQVFGLPYRIFVSGVGVATTMLSVTGVLIWMRKRSARLLARAPRKAGRRDVPDTADLPIPA